MKAKSCVSHFKLMITITTSMGNPVIYFARALARMAALLSGSLLLSGAALADFQGATHLMPFDEDTINYSKTPSDDPIARLQKKIDSGEVELKRDEHHGYYPAVLKYLNIPQSSQVMVFSKTSFQRERIDPKTPRAVYFNDDVYIGFVVGSPLMEVSAVDPKLGGVFYTLDHSAPGKPRFVRTDQCLECHAGAKSMGVPGHLVRSFATDESGLVDLNTGVSQVSHRTPIAERWGGWYVTGKHGSQVHRGNLIGKSEFARNEKEPNFRANIDSLEQFFDTRPYLKNTSDIVALMVLEHQSHMHNFLTRMHYESTIALSQYGHIRYLKSIQEAFVRYLLFAEEAQLAAPIQGSPEYIKDFTSAGPRDSKGRSLRDLDLKTRLFKYPCSFLIYSETFDRLPVMLRNSLYDRLLAILTGKDDSPDFKSLNTETRRAILEILVETKKDIPDSWKKAAGNPPKPRADGR